MDEKVFYDYCYYSVAANATAVQQRSSTPSDGNGQEKSWFHLGLSQGRWLLAIAAALIVLPLAFDPVLLPSVAAAAAIAAAFTFAKKREVKEEKQ